MYIRICIKPIVFNIKAYELLKELSRSIEVLNDLSRLMEETADADKLSELSSKRVMYVNHVKEILMKLIENTHDFDVDMV